MASDDELERRLLEEEPSGMKEATPPGIAMPEVLASLVDKVEKMSSKIINMDSSIKRLQSDQSGSLLEGRTKQKTTCNFTNGNRQRLH